MFGYIGSLLGNINVKEDANSISITGLDARNFLDDIQRFWGTGKIGENLISFQRSKEIGFSKFFAVEILYIVDSLIAQRYTYTSRSTLKTIRERLLSNTWLKDTESKDIAPILDFSKLKNFKLQPKIKQQEFLEHVTIAAPKMKLRGYLLDSAPGTGKAQPLDAQFKTKDGFILNQDVKIGDMILAYDGTETMVTGVFPSGSRLTYRIETVDGRVSESCGEHLWAMYHKSWIGRTVKSLDDILAITRSAGMRTLSIELPRCPNEREVINQVYGIVPASRIAGSFDQTALITCDNKEDALKVRELFWKAGHTARYYEQMGEHRVRTRRPQPNEDRKVEVRSITPLEVKRVQCISIAHPERLYITNDWTVTHNTYTSMVMSEMYGATSLVVVCPKQAVEEPWVKSFNELPKQGWETWTSIDGWEPDFKPGGRYIVHYEYLEKFVAKLRREGTSTFGDKPFITLDESHNMNEAGNASARTGFFLELTSILDKAFVLWMSGTPIKAMGREAIPLIKSIDPMFDRHTEARFREIFGKSSTRANDIIAHRIGLVKFTITKDEVTSTEPTFYSLDAKLPNGKDYELESVKKQMLDFVTERAKYYKSNLQAFYDQYFAALEYVKKTKPALERDIDGYLKVATILNKSYDPRTHKDEPRWCNDFEKKYIIPNLTPMLRDEFRNARSVYKYVDMKIQGEALGKVFGRARINCFIDLANPDLVYVDKTDKNLKLTIMDMINASNSKTLIFTSSVEVVESITKKLNDRGFKTLPIYAKTNKDLTAYRNQLTNDPNTVAAVATFDSLSTAVPMLMCSTTIFLNQPFRDHEREQAISRTYRLGQTEPLDIYDLYLNTGGLDNVSTRAKDIMEWSRQQVAQIMGRKDVGSVPSLEGIDPIVAKEIDWYEESTLPTDVEVTAPAPEYGGLSTYRQETVDSEMAFLKW